MTIMDIALGYALGMVIFYFGATVVFALGKALAYILGKMNG